MVLAPASAVIGKAGQPVATVEEFASAPVPGVPALAPVVSHPFQAPVPVPEIAAAPVPAPEGSAPAEGPAVAGPEAVAPAPRPKAPAMMPAPVKHSHRRAGGGAKGRKLLMSC